MPVKHQQLNLVSLFEMISNLEQLLTVKQASAFQDYVRHAATKSPRIYAEQLSHLTYWPWNMHLAN